MYYIPTFLMMYPATLLSGRVDELLWSYYSPAKYHFLGNGCVMIATRLNGFQCFKNYSWLLLVQVDLKQGNDPWIEKQTEKTRFFPVQCNLLLLDESSDRKPQNPALFQLPVLLFQQS
jgi:hypothetical protein